MAITIDDLLCRGAMRLGTGVLMGSQRLAYGWRCLRGTERSRPNTASEIAPVVYASRTLNVCVSLQCGQGTFNLESHRRRSDSDVVSMPVGIARRVLGQFTKRRLMTNSMLAPRMEYGQQCDMWVHYFGTKVYETPRICDPPSS
jgi:hypothetical protein